MRILDAGCGEGRNLPYFIRNDFDLWGVDTNTAALRLLRLQGASLNLAFDPEKFVEGDLAELPLPPARFDAVICCSVLHFAQDEPNFSRMTDELLRVLKPGGSLFIRMQWEQEKTIENAQPAAPAPSTEETSLSLTPELLNRLIRRHSLRWLEPLRIEQLVGEYVRSTLMLEKVSD